MIFALPLGIETPDYDAHAPKRATPLAFAFAALLFAMFAIDRVVVAGLEHHWRFIPEAVTTVSQHLNASWALYSEPSQFSVWQLWTYALLQDGWWEAIAVLVVVLTIGRSLEHTLGSPRLFAAMLAITAIAGTAHLLHDQSGWIAVGAHGLAGGLIGMAWAVHPQRRVRCVFGYWLVVVVGVVRFTMELRSFALFYIAQDLLRLYVAHELGWIDILLVGVAAGVLMGLLARRSAR